MSYPDPNVGDKTWKHLVKMVDGVPTEIDDTPLSWITDDGTSPPSNEYLAWAGYYEYVREDKIGLTVGFSTQKIVYPSLSEATVDHTNKRVTLSPQVVDLSASEYIAKRDEKLKEIVDGKIAIISGSDWTQESGIATAIKSAWLTYRNTITGINTSTITDPFAFTWPEPPATTEEQISTGSTSPKNFYDAFHETGNQTAYN